MVTSGLLISIILASCLTVVTAGPSNPVILIPGDGGSQLMGKLDKPKIVHYFCSNYTDYYFSLWLNLELLTPYVLDCTVDNLRLVYNPDTKRTSNSPGVDIKTVQFGHTEGVEWLDPSHISVSSYYAPLAARLVGKGYKKGVDLIGAPYDFRKAPNELKLFYANLTRLFEQSYKTNGKPALAVAHSLGNMVFTYFMSTKSQAWKDKYVAGYVCLSAPLAGAAKLFRLYVSGDTLGERFISALSVRPMQRSFPSSAFLLPYTGKHFWDADYPFIITPKRNYTVKDIPTLSKDLNYPNLYELRANTENLVRVDKMHPGVPVYCIHGWDVETPEQFTYLNSMFPDTQPYVKSGQGDGTVNGISLQACDLWNTSRWHFEHKYVNGSSGEHVAILASTSFVDYVASILGV